VIRPEIPQENRFSRDPSRGALFNTRTGPHFMPLVSSLSVFRNTMGPVPA